MKYAIKGALLSGLVFPGVGQVMLKHYKRGAVLIFSVSVLLVIVVAKAVMQALTILEKIESAGGAIDMNAISNAAAVSNSLVSNLLMFLILLGWIIGVVDAYRIGKKKDIV